MEDSTDYILQYIPLLYFDTLREAFIHMGIKIISFTNLNNLMVALEIKSRWDKDIIKEGARKIA